MEPVGSFAAMWEPECPKDVSRVARMKSCAVTFEKSRLRAASEPWNVSLRVFCPWSSPMDFQRSSAFNHGANVVVRVD